MNKHHVKTLYFSGVFITGYYGLGSGIDGYGGFNYESDFLVMNQSTWTRPGGPGYVNGWCDTGYQNLAAAVPDTGIAWIYDYGVMETASHHSFTMLSLMATASWSKDQSWEINSYTEQNGQLVLKASDVVTATFSKAETIHLSSIGHKGDFTNIAAVAFEFLSYGSPGNTCTYGVASYGLQLCIDKIRYRWSKKADLKNDNGQLLTPYMKAHHHQSAPHIAALSPEQTHRDAASGSGHNATAAHASHDYHDQLLSLGHNAALTDQFAMPHPEHFGT